MPGGGGGRVRLQVDPVSSPHGDAGHKNALATGLEAGREAVKMTTADALRHE
jgi:hypothetical protein